MSTFYLLPEKGNWYKANLHCHTVVSDGLLTPEQIKEAYMKQGYSIVAFTDHNKYCKHEELDDDRFLSIAAFEANIDQFSRSNDDWPTRPVYHFNFYDKYPQGRSKEQAVPLPLKRYNDVTYINSYIEELKDMGFIACYNHPYWSLQTYEDYKDLKGLWAMEIYNHGCELDGMYGFHPQSYDEMLRSGQSLYCVATDDNHNCFPFDSPLCDSFGGFVRIRAEKLDYDTVMAALEAGDFHYSLGPEIQEAYVTDNRLYVKTSPVEKIYAILEGRDTYKELAPAGSTITEASFDLTGLEGWLRVQVRDSKGLYAGTNAYRLDKIQASKTSK